MKIETLIYSSARVPEIKSEIKRDAICTLLMIALCVFQGYVVINAYIKKINLNLFENIISIVVVILSFLFILFLITNISKRVSMIKTIKENGTAEFKQVKSNISKLSIVNIIKIFHYVLLTINVVIVTGVITNTIFNYAINREFCYYLPALLFLLLGNIHYSKTLENMFE